MVKINELILDAFENGQLCKCKHYRKYYEPGKAGIGQYLVHNRACDGVLKLAILLERNNEIRPK